MKELSHDKAHYPPPQIIKRPSLYDLPEKWQHKLTNEEQRYVLNSQGVKVGEMDDNALTDGIKNLLKSTWFTSGQKAPEKEDFEFTCLDFKNKLKLYNSHTAFDDIRAALNAGVSKQLKSDLYAMNVSTFMDWISVYLFSKERTSAIGAYQTLLQRTNTEVKQKEELQKIADQMIADEYITFQRTGSCLNVGNSTFRELWRQKKIRFEDAKRDEYLTEATKIIEAENAVQVKNARMAADRVTFLTITTTFEQTKESRIKTMAGTLAVNNYFLQLKAENEKLTKTLDFT